MAFPFLFESNFEEGVLTGWGVKTDVLGRLNFRNYKYLARYDPTKVGPIAPFRGAYCMEVSLQGDTAAYSLTSTSISIADTVTAFSRFYLFLGRDFTFTADDVLTLFAVQSAGADEGAVGLSLTAATNTIQLGVGKTEAAMTLAPQPIARGKWYCIELLSTISVGGAGIQTLFIDGAQVATATAIANLAAIQGTLGVRNQLATTTGTVFFDAYVFDDLRIYPFKDRYPETRYVTKSDHICMGQSELLNVTLLPGPGTNNVLKIYDTDTADITDESNVVAMLYNLTASEPPIDLADVPVLLKRGAYVQLSGTSPRALIHIGNSQGYYSAGRIRQHGFNR